MKKGKLRKPVFISHRMDKPVLMFLWTWKIATTAGVFRRFEPEFKWAYRTVYKRLLSLKERGLVTLYNSNLDNGKVWSLTKEGFQAIRHQLPELAEEGFGSEHVTHDLFVQAVHIGEWLPKYSASGIGIVTEQQLRRIHADHLPEWLPRSKSHRPDGYWYLPSATAPRVVALEVELSRKADEKYREVGSYYGRASQIECVLWVVDGRSLAVRIHEQVKEGVSAFREIHNFISLDDFKQRGWDSAIFLGPDAGYKLSEFLNKGRPNIGGTFAEHPPNICSVSAILDSAIKRLNPVPYVRGASAKVS